MAKEIYNDESNTLLSGTSGNDTIKNRGDSVTINAGAGNDSIENHRPYVSISGGKGNDSLWGGDGADKFIYTSGDGKDVIFGFDNDDMIQITGAFSASYNKSDKAVYFKVGSTSDAITLKNYTATSFNVNGIDYKVSGSKLIEK